MATNERHGLIGRLLARLDRSQHVFLAGLVVAFAVEIVVDWNATFRDVNVLRAGLRDKATHYAAVLRLAAEEPLAAGDRARLGELARRVLEDDEVACVRFTDAAGAPVVEAGRPLGARYPKQLARDTAGVLADPAALREKVARSRHRDVFQAVSDAEDRAVRAFTAGAPAVAPVGDVVYQDRLYDEATRAEDRAYTWAIAQVAPRGKPAGVVLVALDGARVRRATEKKLAFGAVLTLFFLGVILVQQVSARRAKLRLLSFSDALAVARDAIAGSLPTEPPRVAGLDAALAFAQAERLGGTVYDFAATGGALDLFLACPEGSGVDVAFASVFIRDEQRRLRRAMPDAAPESLLAAFVAAYAEAPIHRRLDLALVRVGAGEVTGLCAGLAPPTVVDARGDAIAATVTDLPAPIDASLVEPPLRRFSIAFPPGAALLLYSDGLEPADRHPLTVEEAAAHLRKHPRAPASTVADELRALAQKRARQLRDDLFVFVARRA